MTETDEASPGDRAVCPETEVAQSFCDVARLSAEQAISAALELKNGRRQKEGKSKQGNLKDNEVDLLRAAITFAGAGIDASLKQLVRDALPTLCDRRPDVHDRLRAFSSEVLGPTGEGAVGRRTLADILLSDASSPREVLIDLYVRSLISGSLQSAEQMEKVCAALGVADPALRKRIADAKSASSTSPLRRLFDARNQIVHELDLQNPEKDPRGRKRRSRAVNDVKALVKEGLDVAQKIIHEVAMMLSVDAAAPPGQPSRPRSAVK